MMQDISKLTPEQIQTEWEAAYSRFETPEEEIKKFISRFNALGQKEWRRDAQIVDIFCGRGNGLNALEQLGFKNIEGVDLSPTVLAQYTGAATCHLADCRELPFENASRDIIIVQGGLHHLPSLPEDLDRTLAEVRRVLRPDGRFVVVEPWRTPFLDFMHFVSRRAAARKLSAKVEAFATMNHYEWETYSQWLGAPAKIEQTFAGHFDEIRSQRRLGKLFYVGKPK